MLGANGLRLMGNGLRGHPWMRLAKLVDDDDMDLLEMLHEAMEVVYLKTAARVVLTQFVLAIEGAERGVEDRTSVALYGRGHLVAPEVTGIEWAEELTRGAAGVESAAKRTRLPRDGGANEVGG